MPGKLILIPNTLGSTDPNTFLPSSSIGQITSLKYLIVENIRNARRYLKMLDATVNIDEITFFELNKHT
ncbi:MAG: SAM-dependent methyltransferase, partial [Bacteroidales bacterium]|nr:SAM-dependent methyltransferase [Bacteroidales bacterium]